MHSADTPYKGCYWYIQSLKYLPCEDDVILKQQDKCKLKDNEKQDGTARETQVGNQKAWA